MIHKTLNQILGCALRWGAMRGMTMISSRNLTGVTSTVDSSSTVLKHVSTKPKFEAPYTSTHNPVEHSVDHIGLWYTVPPEDCNSLFNFRFVLPYHYVNLRETFKETSIMIRRPALSVINYIKQLDLGAMPPPKFVFYGNFGCGKTMSIAHVVHFLHKSDYVIVQGPFVHRWLVQPVHVKDEVLPSMTVPERWDHTMDAVTWLKLFRAQNMKKLSQPDFVLSKDYQFSTRESAAKGSTLLSVLDQGINRPRLASDCALTVTTEVKRIANEGRHKVALVLDGMNALFTGTSVYLKEPQVLVELKRYIKPEEFTLCQSFLQFFEDDWKNGVIVGSVDNQLQPKGDREIVYPRYCLGEKGFEKVDPFVAVPVPEYTEKEFESAYRYYASKLFIQKPSALTEEGKNFIATVSGWHPFTVLQTVSSL